VSIVVTPSDIESQATKLLFDLDGNHVIEPRRLNMPLNFSAQGVNERKRAWVATEAPAHQRVL